MVLFHHFAIETNRLEEVKDFYEKILGFQAEDTIEFQGKKLAFLTLGGFRIELVETDETVSGDGAIHLCFETASLTTMMKKLESAGLEKAEGPYKLENGWRTVFYKGMAGETLEFLTLC